jgi:AraC family transcriptional regulator of adaptative response/methylated-DNA-[protein]-cysteine methyltransferase
MEILLDQQEAVSSVEEWAAAAGISPVFLLRVMKRFTGTTPKRVIMEKRNNDLKELLKNGETISASQFAAGFSSSSRLYEKAVSHLGMTPRKYQNGGAGERIVYDFLNTPLGRMLMAATEHGVCSLKFGEKNHELLKELVCEFPAAKIEQQTGELDLWIEQLNAYFSTHQRIFEIPVDSHATVFQLLVWQELRKIPYGEKRSYSEIARSIGKPKAVRAVASACAANPVAIINPCHRVVHSDGSVSGYRWGIDRKKALLKMECDESKDHN